tara:strand:- start:534 stop:1364 length:831 start_codon:yes stop_codon:yes gene_type:complete
MNINKYRLSNKSLSNIKKQNCYCNNCKGNFIKSNLSKTPITSYGIILYYYDSILKDYKFLIIRRKDSLGYIDFIRGKYALSNTTHVCNLINEMTNREKYNILNEDFDILWYKLWNNRYESIDQPTKNKFESIKHGITTNLNLEKIIKNSTTDWEEPEWGFPKGRKNFNEKDFTAALREFTEETGIQNKSIDVIQNISPIDELFIGSNYKAYKHRYYLAKLTDKSIISSLNNYQKTEVSNQGFYTKNEVISKFRPYNKEKIELIKQVHSIVSNYSFK